jgi:hypothetical protein
MDKITFVKKWAVRIAIVLAVIILILGLTCGKVIEGSLFAEVAKWVVMGGIVIVIVELLACYIVLPVIWHFTYGKDA